MKTVIENRVIDVIGEWRDKVREKNTWKNVENEARFGKEKEMMSRSWERKKK